MKNLAVLLVLALGVWLQGCTVAGFAVGVISDAKVPRNRNLVGIVILFTTLGVMSALGWITS